MELTLTKTREEWYIDYMDYREFNGRKKPANDSVRFFLNWCKRQYPDNDYLTQEMIDKRAMSFPAQNERSFASRANAINSFLKYINDRKDGPYVLIEYDHQLPPTEEPVLFTREELLNFFQATDEIEYKEGCKIPYPRFQSKLKAIIVPVIFRLMYSTGLRSGEARHLKCQDVDLDRGVLYLRDVKGYNQRLVALHPSMTEMLRHYDTLMANEMPNREAFFP